MEINTLKKRKHRDKSFLRGVLFVFVAACVAAVGGQVWRWYELHQEVVATQERIARLQEEAERLQEEQRRLGTDEYVEKVAREEYNMVGKNEVPVFIVDGKK